MSINGNLLTTLSRRRDQNWIALYRIWRREFKYRDYSDPDAAAEFYIEAWQLAFNLVEARHAI
jgi:hypothetical protein